MNFKVSSNEPFLVTREADQKSVDVLNLKTSQLTNDSGFLTSHQDISGKQDKLISGTNIKTINSESILGNGDIITGSKIYVGRCNTQASQSTKVVTTESFPTSGGKPLTGTLIAVFFLNTDTSSSNYTYLNVNSTGAIKIMYGSGSYASGKNIRYTGISNVYTIYMYDGTCWRWITTALESLALSGFGYATQNNSSTSSSITATLSNYQRIEGSIVCVKFTYDVPADSMLNINSTGAVNIKYKGSNITAGIIKAGDLVTFVYHSGYQILAIDSSYTKAEIDTALALKQNIDDVYVDQAYVNTNTTNSFAFDNKRYNIAENITLTTDATYEFGSGCILHFYNAGKLNGAANLELNNTQIEAPMKQCFDLNVNFTGLMKNSECYPEWWGAVGDGETDDAAAINRCIYCACRTPVVLTAENYLVKSTVGPDYKVKNTAANTATHAGWGDTYAAQFIVKHSIIGDATLAGPVVRFAISYGYCKIDGTILVRNTSDNAVGFTTCSSSGTLQCVNSNISIGRIDKGTWPLSPLSSTDEGIGLGTGAALIGIWDSTIKIYNVRGFKEGCYLSRFGTNDLWVGRNECVYCFYLGRPKTSWNLANTNWYVHRSRMTLGEQFAGLSSEAFVTEAADSAIIKENGSVEIAMNTWTIGDSNNGNANCRHPHKHSLYYINGNAGHTGNKYTFNITYAIETSRKFVKFDVPSSSKGPNGDEINFGVGCFLQDIDIPYAWNVKLHNVILSNTAKTKGTYRWGGNSGEMLIDTVTITRASTPIFSSSEQTIKLLDINPQFRGSAVSVSIAPSTCANDKFYVVDNPTTTNGTKKYPVYYNYFGNGATLIGYTLDNYKELTPYEGRPKVISNSATYNSTMEENKLYIFGSSTTQVTSFTLTGFTTPVNANVANSYHGIITCGNNMTFTTPNTVTISEGRTLPSFSAGGIFEFDILEIGSNLYLMHFSYTEP